MRTQVNTTQRKNKSKQSIKTRWKHYAKGLKAMKWQLMITKKTQDKRDVIYHKLAIDKGALTIMCGTYEKPQPSVATHWRIVMACACCKAMHTCCL
jgi:hypothetical protein